MLFEDLENRGLVKQITNTEKIRSLLNGEPISFYIGFDPTADSLHVGHLLQLVMAKRLVNAGHKAIMVIGGATALIGDPSGKSSMRKMLTHSDIRVNGEAISSQIINVLKIENENQIWIPNNLAWTDHISFLHMLRELGPYFSVNNMLRAECFKSRLESGLSFLEFNYMLLQAFDFFHLNQGEDPCCLQIGGDDQWSNMLAGIDLIHKKKGKEAFAMTLPLLLNSDGTKMGKTEKGAVWLDKEKTSIFDFWQFWRSIPDTEVKKCFKLLTFIPVEDIDNMPFSNPAEINAAKKKLATAITEIVHGASAATSTLELAETLFESRDSSAIEASLIEDGIQLLDVMVSHGFAKSRTDARNLINNRGIAINDQIVDNPLITITRQTFGEAVLIRKGKKHFGRFVFKEN